MTSQEKGFMGKIGVNNKGFQLGGYRIFATPAFPRKSSKWFFLYGYGVHFTYTREIRYNNYVKPLAPPIVHRGQFFSPGVDGFVSLEYRMLRHPFTISADFSPNFEFFGPRFFRINMSEIDLTLSYVF